MLAGLRRTVPCFGFAEHGASPAATSFYPTETADDQQAIRPQDPRRLRRRGRRARRPRHRAGADQAQVGARLRDVRAVPQVVGVGRRARSRSAPTAATRSQVFPASSLGKESDINQGLTLGTVDIILTGASRSPARTLPAARRRRTSRSSSATPTTCSSTRKSDVFKELAEGLRREDRQPHHGAHLLRRAPRHRRNKPITERRGHEGPEDPRARRAGLPGVPEGAAARTRRRSPSPRSTWRCRTAPSTRRRIRCRRSRRRSSTRCRRTSRSPATSSTRC